MLIGHIKANMAHTFNVEGFAIHNVCCGLVLVVQVIVARPTLIYYSKFIVQIKVPVMFFHDFSL
jgi:hypothetical protein